MVAFGGFRPLQEKEGRIESKAEDADDKDVYIADHIEEIYRYIKAGNISKK